MAWDFSTDAEFQTQLDWMRGFVRDEIEPISLLWPDLHHCPPAPWLRKIVDPLKREVKSRGLWACTWVRNWAATATVRSSLR